MAQDKITRFLFAKAGVRGEIVKFDHSFVQIMKQHHYPDILKQLLGECLGAVVLMANTIKFSGQLTVQFQSEGALKTLVAKCNHLNQIRGYANWDRAASPEAIQSVFNTGQLVVTITSDNQAKPYQSIIQLSGQSISQALQNYFLQSEQLHTFLFCTASTHQAAGLLLQKMPTEDESEADLEYWEHIALLGDTITAQELLELDEENILHRLFHQEEVRLFEPQPVTFKCNCSVDKMTVTVRMLGLEECQKILKTNRQISVTCEYCNKQCHFDKEDIQRLFTTH